MDEQDTDVDDAIITDDRYFLRLAAAYVRGFSESAPEGMNDLETCNWAVANGVRIHDFKRSMELPRVRAVLGVLRQLGPSSILDVGSGRGVFLWPLLDFFPSMPVTAVESDHGRASRLEAASKGGIAELSVLHADVSTLGDSDSFDVTTVLEVLEHVQDPARVASRCIALAERAVVASVPAHPDTNPEHIRLFTRSDLEQLLVTAGARRVNISQVHGHLIAVASK